MYTMRAPAGALLPLLNCGRRKQRQADVLLVGGCKLGVGVERQL